MIDKKYKAMQCNNYIVTNRLSLENAEYTHISMFQLHPFFNREGRIDNYNSHIGLSRLRAYEPV